MSLFTPHHTSSTAKAVPLPLKGEGLISATIAPQRGRLNIVPYRLIFTLFGQLQSIGVTVIPSPANSTGTLYSNIPLSSL